MYDYEKPLARPRYNKMGCCLIGKDLVVPDGYRFPSVCLVTGRPVEGAPREEALYFKPEGGLPGFRFSLAAFAIREFFGEKKKVWYYLDPAVAKRRKRLGVLAVISFISMPVGPVVFLDSWPSVVSFLACAILGFIFLLVRTPRFSLHSKMIRVRGANPDVLKALYEAES